MYFCAACASGCMCAAINPVATQPSRTTCRKRTAHLEWSTSRLIGWGAPIGRNAEALVRALLESRPHPEQGYRPCLGSLRLAKQHGPERLDAACARALAAGARSYRHVESILKHGLDRLPLDGEPAPPSARPVHANVRGSAYYELPDAEGDRPC